jgi:hypothetical protein
MITRLMMFVRIGVISVESKELRICIRGTNCSYHRAGLDPKKTNPEVGQLLLARTLAGKMRLVWAKFVS